MRVMVTGTKVHVDSFPLDTLGGGRAMVAGPKRITLECEALGATDEDINALIAAHERDGYVEMGVASTVGSSLWPAPTASASSSDDAISLGTLQGQLNTAEEKIDSLKVECTLLRAELEDLRELMKTEFRSLQDEARAVEPIIVEGAIPGGW